VKEITNLRFKKLMFSLTHAKCWRGLVHGVAPAIEHKSVVAKLDHDLIIDVGANRGQFSLLCRLLQPQIPIVAFEPIPAEGATFCRVIGHDPCVQFHRVALGESDSEAQIHLSQSLDSSSLLPIGDLQVQLFPSTKETGVMMVSVRCLDNFIQQWRDRRNIFLKLDVQGFELAVLKGGTATLQCCSHVYAECSHVPLYEGQALHQDVAAFLADHEFREALRCNEWYVDGGLVQADYLFERNGS